MNLGEQFGIYLPSEPWLSAQVVRHSGEVEIVSKVGADFGLTRIKSRLLLSQEPSQIVF